jgi:hypothetical protein
MVNNNRTISDPYSLNPDPGILLNPDSIWIQIQYRIYYDKNFNNICNFGNFLD